MYNIHSSTAQNSDTVTSYSSLFSPSWKRYKRKLLCI